MYRPSGIAIVTAGLAGLALFHVIWGRDTRQTETWLQLEAPTSRAALDFGTTFLLHSGAWRAWAPVEEEAVKTPVALPAAEMPAHVAPVAAMAPHRSTASMQQTARGVPGTALPTVATGFVTSPEPAAALAANAPTPPIPPVSDGRMTLGGPEGRGAPTPTPAAPPDHPAPRTHDPASEADAASENKFGAAIFKQFDGKGS